MLEVVLSRDHLALWAPPAVGSLCTRLVILAARRAGRADTSPAPATPKEDPRPPDPIPEESQPDKRSHQRRPGTWVPVLLSDAGGEALPVRGAVLDRSPGGLAIATDAPVPPDTVLSVRAVEHFQEMPWVQVKVRNCRRSGTKYILGCQFLGPQPWDILLFFG